MCYLAYDPPAGQLRGLSRLPSWYTLGRWMGRFDAGGVKALLEVNERLVAELIEHSGLPRLMLDVDGPVVPAGLLVEGARWDLNPHRRYVPSYQPIATNKVEVKTALRKEEQRVNRTTESGLRPHAGILAWGNTGLFYLPQVGQTVGKNSL